MKINTYIYTHVHVAGTYEMMKKKIVSEKSKKYI